jgi:hypothetical protein
MEKEEFFSFDLSSGLQEAFQHKGKLDPKPEIRLD